MDFNTLLYRTIQSGDQYNNLIPATTCKSTATANGNTDLSIQLMVEVIEEFSFQAALVAKKLQANNLQSTLFAIKDFAYNHFQYNADDDLQKIRSFSCSWYDRFNGIDCKSYSIVIGSLLGNLNITYYLRKIKQPGFNPNDFSHVYVVVPIDQQTGNLNSGYYTLDGTLETNKECTFLTYKDFKMNHAKLNGVSENFNPDFQSLGLLKEHNKSEEVVLVDTDFEAGLKGLGFLPIAAIGLKVLGPKLAASFIGKMGIGAATTALQDVVGKVTSRVQQLMANQLPYPVVC